MWYFIKAVNSRDKPHHSKFLKPLFFFPLLKPPQDASFHPNGTTVLQSVIPFRHTFGKNLQRFYGPSATIAGRVGDCRAGHGDKDGVLSATDWERHSQRPVLLFPIGRECIGLSIGGRDAKGFPLPPHDDISFQVRPIVRPFHFHQTAGRGQICILYKKGLDLFCFVSEL